MTFRCLLAGFCAFAAIFIPGCAHLSGPPNQLSKNEQAAGWRLLFDGQTTHGWRSFRRKSFPAQGWEARGGWLHCLGQKGGDIITDEEFDDFELRWDWKLAPGGNSGVKYFVTETRDSVVGHEYQMIDDDKNADAAQQHGKRVTASFYDVLAPSQASPRPPGETNQSRILIQGNRVEHWLNGSKVLEYDCGSKALNEAVARSKFREQPGFGNKIRGHILLQDHHSEVWFRNIMIRESHLH